jgi:hypothetical protein
MKILLLCGGLLLAVAAYATETETPPQVMEEPTLHDHYVSLKRMQQSLAGRPLDEQAKLQPQIQRAQQKACQRLRKDHQERISREQYRREGGDEFLVFSLELEQWCATAR